MSTPHHRLKRIKHLADYSDNSNGFGWDNSEIVFGDPLTISDRKQKQKERARNRWKEMHSKQL